ncbi:MAG: hypothetical protein CM1200mP28_00680 [Deltaproteobacteria bacterium]|nr:MAG: hypothetical protein CM1200mP28_00680 [Deltaproteobacteria bacterium]
MNNSNFTTQGGIEIEKAITPLEADSALNKIYQYIDTHKGALFVSNYEVPDRYSRWDLGFVNPALELIAKKREFQINALNPNGSRILKVIEPEIQKHPHLENLNSSSENDNVLGMVSGTVKEMTELFPEEERSRQPSVFSVIRTIFKLFRSDDPYLGLYGAFGYDLVFQFETIQAKHGRDADQSDLHLFLPVEMVIVDRQKEEAYKIEYHIQTPAGMTESWWNTGSEYSVATGNADGKIQCDHEIGEFERKVSKIRDGCKRGDFFEVCFLKLFPQVSMISPQNCSTESVNRIPVPTVFLSTWVRSSWLGHLQRCM